MLPSAAHAIGFGNLVSQSAIGEPFRAEFKLFGVGAGEGADCLRVVATSEDDGIPQLRSARIKIQGKGASATAIVTRREPVSDPIIRVTLEEICSARLQRTYTLLLPMPTAIVKAPTVVPSRPEPIAQKKRAPGVSADALGGTYTLSQPTSINALARQMFPDSRADRAAFVAALLSANAGERSLRATRKPLATGTTLMLPTRGEIDEARAQQRAQALRQKEEAAATARAKAKSTPQVEAAPSPVAEAAPAEPAGESSPQPQSNNEALATAPDEKTDRLVLDGDTPALHDFKLSSRLGDPELIESMSEEERDVLRREQQLVMAIDAQIKSRMALADRIARLEALEKALKMEIPADTTDGNSVAAGASPTTIAPEAPTNAPAPVVPATPDNATPSPAEAPMRPTVESTSAGSVEISFNWWTIAGAGAVLLLIATLWSRRKASNEAYDDESSADTTQLVTKDTTPVVTQSQPAAAPDTLPGEGRSFDFETIEWDAPPPATLEVGIAPIGIEEQETAEEHESAVELADIMMSFGRVQGAAETLAEFIRGNPKKAVQPWIKLLEVYKAADMRTEFDALTHQLNKTFNVKTVTWESFDEVKKAPDSVEQMPHIINGLKEQWMTVDCQLYLQMLLRDNRGGTREGFPLGVVDDLLMLQAVQEDILGPYRPSEDEIAAAMGGENKTADTRPGNPNGFVAPPAELAPEMNFDEGNKPEQPATIDARDIFDLDLPREQTELPDLDFQLDSQFLMPEEGPEDSDLPSADDYDIDPENALRATWVLPKKKDED